MFMCNAELVKITLGFMLFDVITGTLAAIKHKELSSTIAREGLFHKMSFIALIAFAIFLEYAQTAVPELGLTVPTTVAVCAVICFIELQSVIENIARMLPDEIAAKIIDLFRLDNEKFEYLYDEAVNDVFDI